MKSTWGARYGNDIITIENAWFSGEKLYVNGNLQDFNTNFYSSNLVGHVISFNGEKLVVKARIIQDFLKLDCVLFVDDKLVSLNKIK